MEQTGSLDLWIGSMYSGKTTTLIQAYKKYVYIGKKVIVINYDQDKRYHETMLSTHDKVMIPCPERRRNALHQLAPEALSGQGSRRGVGRTWPDQEGARSGTGHGQ